MRLAATALGMLLLPVVSIAAVSKAELQSLTQKGVGVELIVKLVEKDCVDFEVDAPALLELSGTVPEAVLNAAIECRKQALANSVLPVNPQSEALEAPLTLRQVKRIVVVPSVVDGSTNAAMSTQFVEQLKLLRPSLQTVDSVAMQLKFEDPAPFNALAPLKALLAAARAVGADALLLSEAAQYRGGLFGTDPGVRVDVKIVEVVQGGVLWSGGTEDIADSFEKAKRGAARALVKKLPKW